jgi:hypothetical protein
VGTSGLDETAVDRMVADLATVARGAREASLRAPGASAYLAGFLPLPGAFVSLVA